MILGCNITKIEVKSHNYIGGFDGVNISCDVKLNKPPMVITQTTTFGDKDILRIEYQIVLTYVSPSIGHMLFEGYLDYFSDQQQILKQEWDNIKDNNVNQIKTYCGNAILTNIMPIALLLSNRVNLPPVIPIPKISFGQKENKDDKEPQNYIG